jgi:DNA repair exonuclease SbcCD nuclease subunit
VDLVLRLLHTGDVHLGRPFGLLGDFGRIVRQQIRATFSRVLALGRERNAAAILIAGDLFDAERPDPSDLRFVLEEVRKLRPLPVYLLPGTHDLLGPHSVYRRIPERPDNLFVFDQDGPHTFVHDALGLAVHARATHAKRGGEPPLAGIHADPRARYNIAMAHASVPRADIPADSEHDAVVTEAEIRRTGVRYVALGHWHKTAEYFPGNAFRTWYAGSPETLQFEDGDGSGYALEVVLGDDRVEVTPHRVGRYEWREVAIAVPPEGAEEGVRQAILQHEGPNRIVRVRLAGDLPAAAVFDAQALKEQCVGRFAHLSVETDALRTRWEQFDATTVFPDGTIGAAFVRLALERLAQAGEEGRPLWEEVLRRGTALLANREDIG